jgi:hypothetical protein
MGGNLGALSIRAHKKAVVTVLGDLDKLGGREATLNLWERSHNIVTTFNQAVNKQYLKLGCLKDFMTFGDDEQGSNRIAPGPNPGTEHQRSRRPYAFHRFFHFADPG